MYLLMQMYTELYWHKKIPTNNKQCWNDDKQKLGSGDRIPQQGPGVEPTVSLGSEAPEVEKWPWQEFTVGSYWFYISLVAVFIDSGR